MDNISIGYLSWKRNKILNQTLNSHNNNGLFNIVPKQNRIIFFQELSNEDIDDANKFNCNYIGNSLNIGILNGFIKLVESCKTEYFIFCENDWVLIEKENTTRKIIEDCIQLLNSNNVDIVKLRSRKKPGNPLYSKPKIVNEWLSQNCDGFPYKLESLSWLDEPNKIYNNLLDEYDGNYKWYITTLKHQSWSNNVFICKTNYLNNIILPLLKTSITNKLDNYTGLEDILIKYNNYIGINSYIDSIIENYKKTKIAAGEGLFEHKDFI
jgi:hypothetical protein